MGWFQWSLGRCTCVPFPSVLSLREGRTLWNWCIKNRYQGAIILPFVFPRLTCNVCLFGFHGGQSFRQTLYTHTVGMFTHFQKRIRKQRQPSSCRWKELSHLNVRTLLLYSQRIFGTSICFWDGKCVFSFSGLPNLVLCSYCLDGKADHLPHP